MTKAKIGLALGGGAARGWAHIGVLKALLKAGIKPDIIVGTSIGAVVGGCHAAGHLEELEGFARELTRRRVFGYLDFNFGGTALINGQRLCNRLEQHLGDLRIEDLPSRFSAVATELGSGHEIWLSRGKLVESMRASYALPGIFRPVKINDRWLFDGALVNPIPVSVARAHGARYVIAVNLNFDSCGRGTVVPHIESEEAPASTAVAEPAAEQSKPAMRRLLKRQVLGRSETTPGISRVMVEAFNIVQDRIARSRLAGDPPDALINLQLSDIGLFDFHRADELIQRGEAAAQRHIADVRREINARNHIYGGVHAETVSQTFDAGG
ncbi:patatin-like phospholipase family protein [Hyphomicrobium sulfonivorans]|uniref:patatin-like phospholipase family protein n=1 Tax=Hyphomicrobium sulfonivorans TaxID=121290 RepID=UPI00156E03B7|nr:patatin-like phospholipase family protein [Hyphomicrobium sulfonivorans]MBI1650636.1 patatin-like phospholipase family protein [Hyphomicrobium sulfonivorans]NSL72005.1 NTE family protein rssA [Hyphomicrobium sulfonivorans]